MLRPTLPLDPLAGHVEIEVSLVYEMIEALDNIVLPCDKEESAWAVRVRDHLKPQSRATLDEIGFFVVFSFAKSPLPRTLAEFFVWLDNIPDTSFVDDVMSDCWEPMRDIITKLRRKQILTADEFETLADKTGDKALVERAITTALFLNDQATIKKRVVALLRDFHDSFFQRETDRIWPILEESANRARAGVESGLVPMRQIIENLTNGLTLAENVHYKRVVLAPSFFGAPFVGFFDLPGDGVLILYPARPEGMRVDGERVDNERLLRRLKALADKTRLEILQLLAQRPHYTQELADALNLKQPTIWHHMRDLRVAGIIRVEEADNAKIYSLRPEFVEAVAHDLYNFLDIERRD